MEEVSSGKIGRYDILRVLGRGSIGEVILAEDEYLGRRVAIKRPFRSAVADSLVRFEVEANAAALRHPGIPVVYEMGIHEGLPFIAMEYVEGETLERIIESRKELDLITRLQIIEQACSAVAYAHRNGIIHRDLRPANIIVQPDGRAKIIDFGIARFHHDAHSGLAKTRQHIGSLEYVAPERFSGGKIDGRIDIFSLGVILFKLIAGKEPESRAERNTSFGNMHESRSSLGYFPQVYPPALKEIVRKSLARNPDDRYPTGEDFADALHEVVAALKRNRVAELFNGAERLTNEKQFASALELLDEAIRLDPENVPARKLRKSVRESQDRIRRAARLQACLLKSDQALLSENLEEALAQLRDAQNLDPNSVDIKSRLRLVEAKKRRLTSTTWALDEAEKAKTRRDFTGALRIIAKALQDDSENDKLISQNAALMQQIEIEAQRARILELLEKAARGLATRDYDAAQTLLAEITEIDNSNQDAEKLRAELAKARELEQHWAFLNHIQSQVQSCIKNDAYDQATDLINRALDTLPNEMRLHRLKAEVDAEARQYDVRWVVDLTISQASELFVTSPFEALSLLEKALDNIPGEERLVACERSLRHQLQSQRPVHLHGG